MKHKIVFAIYSNFFFQLIILITNNFKLSYLIHFCHIVNIVAILLHFNAILVSEKLFYTNFCVSKVFFLFYRDLSEILFNFDIF